MSRESVPNRPNGEGTILTCEIAEKAADQIIDFVDRARRGLPTDETGESIPVILIAKSKSIQRMSGEERFAAISLNNNLINQVLRHPNLAQKHINPDIDSSRVGRYKVPIKTVDQDGKVGKAIIPVTVIDTNLDPEISNVHLVEEIFLDEGEVPEAVRATCYTHEQFERIFGSIIDFEQTTAA